MIDVTKLKAGDIVTLNEIIYTARDAAHLRLKNLIDENKPLPVDFKDSFIYYAGPTPTKPGTVIGSIGPTTSCRMDKFVSYMKNLGIKGMIGKGPRDPSVTKACKDFKMVYLIVTGGAGALLSKRIISAEEIAFEDLGCESIKRLEVKDFPVIVAIDCEGNNIFERI